jgi:hypothetical protein
MRCNRQQQPAVFFGAPAVQRPSAQSRPASFMGCWIHQAVVGHPKHPKTIIIHHSTMRLNQACMNRDFKRCVSIGQVPSRRFPCLLKFAKNGAGAINFLTPINFAINGF